MLPSEKAGKEYKDDCTQMSKWQSAPKYCYQSFNDYAIVLVANM